MHVLFKISFLKEVYLVRDCKCITFGSNSQFKLSQSPYTVALSGCFQITGYILFVSLEVFLQ